MRIRCEQCGKKYREEEWSCPKCGHYNSATKNYTINGAQGGSASPGSYTQNTGMPTQSYGNMPPSSYGAQAPGYSAPPPSYGNQPQPGQHPSPDFDEIFGSFFGGGQVPGGPRPTYPMPAPQVPQKNRGQTGRRTAVVLLAGIAAMLILLAWFVNQRSGIGGGIGGGGGAGRTQVDNSAAIAQLKTQVEANPTEYDALVELIALLCEEGKEGEARHYSGYLYTTGCESAEVFRRAALPFVAINEEGMACELYLSAYAHSGDAGDLKLAEACGSPAQLIGRGADGNSAQETLEAFFGEPIGSITWRQMGSIQYLAYDEDTVTLSLLNPAEAGEAEFAESLVSFTPENGGSLATSYLYGLKQLDIYSGRLSAHSLYGLPLLEGLYINSVSGTENMQQLALAPGLKSLRVGGTSLDELDWLALLPGLESLNLNGTGISDLAPLATCANLQELTLYNNKELTSLEALAELPHLRGLHVQRQDIMDFSFLQGYHSLEALTIEKTDIKDFYYIAQLDTLTYLKLVNNGDLAGIEGIGGLQGLETLYVKTDMPGGEEVAGLTGLTYLYLEKSRTLGVVTNLTALETLHIGNCSALDLAPVANLTNLHTFILDSYFNYSDMRVSFDAMVNLPNLTYVKIGSNGIISESFYGSMQGLLSNPNIQYLDISDTQMDISPGFAAMTGLVTLKLSDVKIITNIRISGGNGMYSIGYDDVEMDRVAASLAGLPNLETLEIADTNLTDISFVSSLPALRHIDLADNYITDIAPLNGAPALEWADLTGNPVRNWDAAEGDWTLVR